MVKAFRVAEKELGIPPQVSAIEMAENEKTDILIVVTYLTQYYEAFKDEKPGTNSFTSLPPPPVMMMMYIYIYIWFQKSLTQEHIYMFSFA